MEVSVRCALRPEKMLATESPLQMLENSFFFVLKSLSVFKIFKFLSWLFRHVEKWLDWKYKFNFLSYDVTKREANKCKTHFVQYLTKKSNQKMKFGQLMEYNMRYIFLEKSCKKCGGEIFPDPSPKNQN